jgi:hypothetical protein
MKKNKFSLNIETLVLVAIWNNPFIFQGSFSITNTKNDSIQLLFFRCECSLNNKMDILDSKFSPYDYKVTHLYDSQSRIHLSNINDDIEQALYLLKYALKETLQKMLSKPNHYLIHIDEIAMSSIEQQITDHLLHHREKRIDNDNIGFAVSIIFTPTESVGKKAALTLLKLNTFSQIKSRLH